MIGTRRGKRAKAVAIGAVLCAAAAGAALLQQRHEVELPARTEAERPSLMLLTSLPLVFGERLSLDGGSRALEALERRYRVVPIAVADEESLKQGTILLMAHARAQPAESLVALDAWVRGGGRLLLLADPLLEWHSERALGDPLRPSPMFPDSGLLAHWGLRLGAPDQRGAAQRTLGGRQVLAVSPGSLSGACSISKDRFVADCKIGKGRAIIVADADFLDVDEAGGSTERNLEALLAQLGAIEKN